MLSLTPVGDARWITQGSAEECGRSTASIRNKRRIRGRYRVTREGQRPGTANRQMVETGKNCRFRFFTLKRLTVTAAEPYIGPLGCAAASARWRVREAPHCLHGDRASGHARGHVRVTASNTRGLGLFDK